MRFSFHGAEKRAHRCPIGPFSGKIVSREFCGALDISWQGEAFMRLRKRNGYEIRSVRTKANANKAHNTNQHGANTNKAHIQTRPNDTDSTYKDENSIGLFSHRLWVASR